MTPQRGSVPANGHSVRSDWSRCERAGTLGGRQAAGRRRQVAAAAKSPVGSSPT